MGSGGGAAGGRGGAGLAYNWRSGGKGGGTIVIIWPLFLLSFSTFIIICIGMVVIGFYRTGQDRVVGREGVGLLGSKQQ